MYQSSSKKSANYISNNINFKTYISFAVKKYNVLDAAIKEVTETRSTWRKEQESNNLLLKRVEGEINKQETQKQFSQLHDYLFLPQHSLPKRYILGGIKKTDEVNSHVKDEQKEEIKSLRKHTIKQVVATQQRESKLMGAIIDISIVAAKSKEEWPSPLFKKPIINGRAHLKKPRPLTCRLLKSKSPDTTRPLLTVTTKVDNPSLSKDRCKNSEPEIGKSLTNLSFLSPRTASVSNFVSSKVKHLKKFLRPHDTSTASAWKEEGSTRNPDYYEIRPLTSRGRTRADSSLERRYSQGSPLEALWSPVIKNSQIPKARKRPDTSTTNMSRSQLSQEHISSPRTDRCFSPSVINLLGDSFCYTINDVETPTERSYTLTSYAPQRTIISSSHSMFRRKPTRGILMEKYSSRCDTTNIKRRFQTENMHNTFF